MIYPEVKPVRSNFFTKPILLGAHRGGAMLWPENTLFAFRQAVRRWPDVVLETDVRLTRDGALVLMHDPTVERTTDGAGEVARLSLAELRQLDAGCQFSSDFGRSFPFRGRGIGVPTLSELLQALPHSRTIVECKEQAGIAEAALQVIWRTGAQDRVLVGSFSPQVMEEVRERARGIPTCYDLIHGEQMLQALRSGAWHDYQPSDAVLAIDIQTITHYQLTPQEVQTIRQKAIRFLVYTVNSAEEMKQMLRLDVEGILSDRPDLLAETIKAHRKNG